MFLQLDQLCVVSEYEINLGLAASCVDVDCDAELARVNFDCLIAQLKYRCGVQSWCDSLLISARILQFVNNFHQGQGVAGHQDLGVWAEFHLLVRPVFLRVLRYLCKLDRGELLAGKIAEFKRIVANQLRHCFVVLNLPSHIRLNDGEKGIVADVSECLNFLLFGHQFLAQPYPRQEFVLLSISS